MNAFLKDIQPKLHQIENKNQQTIGYIKRPRMGPATQGKTNPHLDNTKTDATAFMVSMGISLNPLENLYTTQPFLLILFMHKGFLQSQFWLIQLERLNVVCLHGHKIVTHGRNVVKSLYQIERKTCGYVYDYKYY